MLRDKIKTKTWLEKIRASAGLTLKGAVEVIKDGEPVLYTTKELSDREILDAKRGIDWGYKKK